MKKNYIQPCVEIHDAALQQIISASTITIEKGEGEIPVTAETIEEFEWSVWEE